MAYRIIPSTERTRDIYADCDPRWAEDAKRKPYRVEYGDRDLLYENGYYMTPSMSFVDSLRTAESIALERIRETIQNGWGTEIICVFDNQTNSLVRTYNSNDHVSFLRRRKR